MKTKRKHLVKTAEIWFNKAQAFPVGGAKSLALEKAYNHVESALAWLLDHSTEDVKKQFFKIQEPSVDHYHKKKKN